MRASAAPRATRRRRIEPIGALARAGSVEITAQQTALLAKQMAENGQQQGWLTEAVVQE